MRESLLDYLCCPACHGDLVLDGPVWSGRTIVAGHVACTACAARYPITEGVPDFVAANDAESVQQTTEGFADNWKHYNRVILSNELLNRDLFADWIWPLQPTTFEGKVVYEAGCGMGRWLRLAAEHRPKVLIGFDYSTVAFTAQKNVAHLDNVHVVRADIFRLPLRPKAQVLYSIGVVHHTPDPARAFRCLENVVAEDGVISTWVYGKENNGWITTLVDPIRKHVTSRLPAPALQALSQLAALELRAASEAYAAVGAPRFLPYREYLLHLREYPLSYMTHIVYDHLVPSLAHYLPKEELLRWAEGLAFVLSPRNANSWRLLVGRRSDAVRAAMAPLQPDRLGAGVTVSVRA
jgi:SAM-dependent methyltransferase